MTAEHGIDQSPYVKTAGVRRGLWQLRERAHMPLQLPQSYIDKFAFIAPTDKPPLPRRIAPQTLHRRLAGPPSLRWLRRRRTKKMKKANKQRQKGEEGEAKKAKKQTNKK